ncbi:MAG TPA: GNAT family N-acetyltransferase [Terricaulis sp.]|nr:GNAT family N-acetyltransferase [Terricaulis sp.]
MAPVLETERLILRGHKLGDFAALSAMWADPAVVRFISGKPSTQEESWGRMLRYPGMWALLGYSFWAIEEKSSGQIIGEGGFADFKREISPPIEAPEMGWALSPAAQGKGYAFEALSAMLAWGEAHFRRRDFACIIAPENAPSIRLAERLGFREAARGEYKTSPTIFFRRDR